MRGVLKSFLIISLAFEAMGHIALVGQKTTTEYTSGKAILKLIMNIILIVGIIYLL